jgi:enoyl-CoA hydratase
MTLRVRSGDTNVLGLEEVRALRSSFVEARERGTVEAVMLFGRSHCFCAGLDQAVLFSGGVDAQRLLLETGELLYEIYSSPLRVVAGCRGHAVAAGAMLLLVSDVRVGAEGSYRVGFSEVNYGLSVPEIAVLLARDRLVRRFLQSATLLGRLCGPVVAARVGFLDRVVAADDLEKEARSTAESLLRIDAGAYRGTLDTVRGRTLRRMREILDERKAALVAASQSPTP